MMVALGVMTTDDVYLTLNLETPENSTGVVVDLGLEEKLHLWTYFADGAVQLVPDCCEFAVKIRTRKAEVGVEVSGEVLAKNEKTIIRAGKGGTKKNKLTL